MGKPFRARRVMAEDRKREKERGAAHGRRGVKKSLTEKNTERKTSVRTALALSDFGSELTKKWAKKVWEICVCLRNLTCPPFAMSETAANIACVHGRTFT